MKDWGVLLTLFAASVNVITTGVLCYFGHIGRRRDKIQREIIEMLYGRVLMIEKTMAIVAEEHRKHGSH